MPSKFKTFCDTHPEYLQQHYNRISAKTLECKECGIMISRANKTMHNATYKHQRNLKKKESIEFRKKLDNLIEENNAQKAIIHTMMEKYIPEQNTK